MKKRELVTADAGRASAMSAPRGKFVPYIMATAARIRRGPAYDDRMDSIIVLLVVLVALWSFSVVVAVLVAVFVVVVSTLEGGSGAKAEKSGPVCEEDILRSSLLFSACSDVSIRHLRT